MSTAEQVKAFFDGDTKEIRRIFVNRLDDEMFEKVGREVSEVPFSDDDKGRLKAVQCGFEWLVGYQPIGY